MFQNNKLKIKQSTIKEAGEGVFAIEFIQKNTIICEYTGILCGDKYERNFVSDKSVELDCGYEIIGTGIGSKINDICIVHELSQKDKKHIMNTKIIPKYLDKNYNCQFLYDGSGSNCKVFIKSLLDIYK